MVNVDTTLEKEKNFEAEYYKLIAIKLWDILDSINNLEEVPLFTDYYLNVRNLLLKRYFYGKKNIDGKVEFEHPRIHTTL